MMIPKRKPELVEVKSPRSEVRIRTELQVAQRGRTISKPAAEPSQEPTRPSVMSSKSDEAAAPSLEQPKKSSGAQPSAATPTATVASNDDGLGGYVNRQFVSDLKVEQAGFQHLGNPQQLAEKLSRVGYQCLPFLAVQVALLLNSKSNRIRSLLLEGPSGCGKSYFAKSLAKISGAELMCLSCYKGMPTQNLIEAPSTLAMANAMAGKASGQDTALMNLGVLSRAYLASQDHPVVLLIDELDKPDAAIDTFFLGPIQDARIWLESRPPIDANVDNLILIFTKNWNRSLDEALLRRVHPIKMTYLDSTLERKILSSHCHPQLVDNIVSIADRMRNSGGSYAFERPPAPEELLAAGQYVAMMLDWGIFDFGTIGRHIWATLAKSEHDRAVLEHMMRFHPDFMDPLFPDAKNTPVEEIYARLGRIVLTSIVDDPDRSRREQAWKDMDNY